MGIGRQCLKLCKDDSDCANIGSEECKRVESKDTPQKPTLNICGYGCDSSGLRQLKPLGGFRKSSIFRWAEFADPAGAGDDSYIKQYGYTYGPEPKLSAKPTKDEIDKYKAWDADMRDQVQFCAPY